MPEEDGCSSPSDCIATDARGNTAQRAHLAGWQAHHLVAALILACLVQACKGTPQQQGAWQLRQGDAQSPRQRELQQKQQQAGSSQGAQCPSLQSLPIPLASQSSLKACPFVVEYLVRADVQPRTDAAADGYADGGGGGPGATAAGSNSTQKGRARGAGSNGTLCSWAVLTNNRKEDLYGWQLVWRFANATSYIPKGVDGAVLVTAGQGTPIRVVNNFESASIAPQGGATNFSMLIDPNVTSSGWRDAPLDWSSVFINGQMCAKLPSTSFQLADCSSPYGTLNRTADPLSAVLCASIFCCGDFDSSSSSSSSDGRGAQASGSDGGAEAPGGSSSGPNVLSDLGKALDDLKQTILLLQGVKPGIGPGPVGTLPEAAAPPAATGSSNTSSSQAPSVTAAEGAPDPEPEPDPNPPKEEAPGAPLLDKPHRSSGGSSGAGGGGGAVDDSGAPGLQPPGPPALPPLPQLQLPPGVSLKELLANVAAAANATGVFNVTEAINQLAVLVQSLQAGGFAPPLLVPGADVPPTRGQASNGTSDVPRRGSSAGGGGEDTGALSSGSDKGLGGRNSAAGSNGSNGNSTNSINSTNSTNDSGSGSLPSTGGPAPAVGNPPAGPPSSAANVTTGDMQQAADGALSSAPVKDGADDPDPGANESEPPGRPDDAGGNKGADGGVIPRPAAPGSGIGGGDSQGAAGGAASGVVEHPQGHPANNITAAGGGGGGGAGPPPAARGTSSSTSSNRVVLSIAIPSAAGAALLASALFAYVAVRVRRDGAAASSRLQPQRSPEQAVVRDGGRGGEAAAAQQDPSCEGLTGPQFLVRTYGAGGSGGAPGSNQLMSVGSGVLQTVHEEYGGQAVLGRGPPKPSTAGGAPLATAPSRGDSAASVLAHSASIPAAASTATLGRAGSSTVFHSGPPTAPVIYSSGALPAAARLAPRRSDPIRGMPLRELLTAHQPASAAPVPPVSAQGQDRPMGRHFIHVLAGAGAAGLLHAPAHRSLEIYPMPPIDDVPARRGHWHGRSTTEAAQYDIALGGRAGSASHLAALRTSNDALQQREPIPSVSLDDSAAAPAAPQPLQSWRSSPAAVLYGIPSLLRQLSNRRSGSAMPNPQMAGDQAFRAAVTIPAAGPAGAVVAERLGGAAGSLCEEGRVVQQQHSGEPRAREGTSDSPGRMYGGATAASGQDNSPGGGDCLGVGRQESAAALRGAEAATTAACAAVQSPPALRHQVSWVNIDFEREITVQGKLGAGAFGTVYKATWGERVVAVKLVPLMEDATTVCASALESLKQEVQVLSRLSHPNIIDFYGACLAPPNVCIVEELATGGSLYQRLHAKRRGAPMYPRMTYKEVLQVGLEVASAMAYLHPTVVHRDLKPQNVLLSDGRAKVCDFGIAKMKDRTYFSTRNAQAGTPAYMAPEQFEGRPVTEAVDMFAFGVLLNECMTGEQPWAQLNAMQVIFVVGVQCQRPPLLEGCAPTMAELIRQCWDDDPARRPPFAEIVRRLQAELESVSVRQPPPRLP